MSPFTKTSSYNYALAGHKQHKRMYLMLVDSSHPFSMNIVYELHVCCLIRQCTCTRVACKLLGTIDSKFEESLGNTSVENLEQILLMSYQLVGPIWQAISVCPYLFGTIAMCLYKGADNPIKCTCSVVRSSHLVWSLRTHHKEGCQDHAT